MQSLAEFWKIWQNSANFALSCTTSNVSNFIKTFSANYFQGHYCWNVLYNTCLFWLSKLFFIIINRFNSRISILQRINIFFSISLSQLTKTMKLLFYFLIHLLCTNPTWIPLLRSTLVHSIFTHTWFLITTFLFAFIEITFPLTITISLIAISIRCIIFKQSDLFWVGRPTFLNIYFTMTVIHNIFAATALKGQPLGIKS